MRNLKENLSSAVQAIRNNWLRSTLTMLGIIIGVGSVVLLIGIGTGVKDDIGRQIESLGANTVIVVPGKPDKSGMPNPMSTLGISTLTDKDAADVGRLRGVETSMALMFVFGSVERQDRSCSTLVIAAPAAIDKVWHTPCVSGRFYTEADANDRVAVLSHTPGEELFGTKAAVGEMVTIRGVEFRVVGVQRKEQESLLGPGTLSNVVFVPLEAARSAYTGGQINRIVSVLDYRVDPTPIRAAIKELLLRNHGGHEDFAVVTQAQLMQAIFRVFNIVEALLVGISAISLVVAGIGIMNIMLVTVTERTREIGIRKTVGARRVDIFQQFLTEAVLLSFLGGVVGTTIATVICHFVTVYTPLKPVITLGAISLAFGVCFAVGIAFGVTPALRAARKDPIEALRWE